jgi:hypothetical protein
MAHQSRHGQKNSESMNLKQRRAEARLKQMGLSTPRSVAPSRKILNMRWINDALDQVLVELSEYSSQAPEIQEATEAIQDAKQLLVEYGQVILNTPFKGQQENNSYSRPKSKPYRGQYDNFDANGGFDDASTLFKQQHDDAREEELQGIYRNIEKDTDEKLRGQGIEPCRDEEGHFTDC